jgi:CBS domain-containing protein
MSIDTIPVSTYMSTKGVITETIDQTIYAACRTMNKNDVGCVIIVDKSSSKSDKPVGIITERDVVRILGKLDAASLHSPLREIMSKPLVTISINGTIKDTIHSMYRNNIRRLVIVDRETTVGIITDKDIFRALMNNQILISSLGSIEPIAEQRTAYDQFTEYWFRDIYHKQ